MSRLRRDKRYRDISNLKNNLPNTFPTTSPFPFENKTTTHSIEAYQQAKAIQTKKKVRKAPLLNHTEQQKRKRWKILP
jgi:hypothetical protein